MNSSSKYISWRLSCTEHIFHRLITIPLLFPNQIKEKWGYFCFLPSYSNSSLSRYTGRVIWPMEKVKRKTDGVLDKKTEEQFRAFLKSELIQSQLMKMGFMIRPETGSWLWYHDLELLSCALAQPETNLFWAFQSNWYGRPNPEDRINRKPEDQIYDQRTE